MSQMSIEELQMQLSKRLLANPPDTWPRPLLSAMIVLYDLMFDPAKTEATTGQAQLHLEILSKPVDRGVSGDLRFG